MEPCIILHRIQPDNIITVLAIATGDQRRPSLWGPNEQANRLPSRGSLCRCALWSYLRGPGRRWGGMLNLAGRRRAPVSSESPVFTPDDLPEDHRAR